MKKRQRLNHTVLRAAGASPTEVLIYDAVWLLSRSEGYCFAQNDYLAKQIGMSTRTVSRGISKLVALGLLRYEIVANPQRKCNFERRLAVCG